MRVSLRRISKLMVCCLGPLMEGGVMGGAIEGRRPQEVRI